MKKLGIVLIVVGIVASLISGFTLITKKKVVDLGKIEINREEKTPIYWSPYVGIGILAVGVILFVGNKEK
jgi:hypothetical protein